MIGPEKQLLPPIKEGDTHFTPGQMAVIISDELWPDELPAIQQPPVISQDISPQDARV